jgi:hypothetical protein
MPTAWIPKSGINDVKHPDDQIVLTCDYVFDRLYQKSVCEPEKLVANIIQVIRKMGWTTK